MSLLSKIIPFYGIIEDVVHIGGDAIREDQKRRTLRTEAELQVYMQTEYEKRCSEIRQQENRANAEIEVYRQTEAERQQAEIKDEMEQRAYQRQMTFEQNRVELFERIKKNEVEIHEQLIQYEISQRKEIAEWQRTFNRNLEIELEQAMTNKLPKMLHQAQQFEQNPTIYENFVSRAFQVADHIIKSIIQDQEYFRDSLKEIAQRPGQLTESLLELNRHLQLPVAPTIKQLPEYQKLKPKT